MAKFITADPHFGHENVIKFCPLTRGQFRDAEEMNESIIKQWNEVVSDRDVVYLLGDISMKMKKEDVWHLLSRLRGRLVIVRGNHDPTNLISYLKANNYRYGKGQKFELHDVGLMVVENGKEYYLTHYPIDLGHRPVRRRNLHGHLHQNETRHPACLNIGMDSTEIGVSAETFGRPLAWELAKKKAEIKWSRTI